MLNELLNIHDSETSTFDDTLYGDEQLNGIYTAVVIGSTNVSIPGYVMVNILGITDNTTDGPWAEPGPSVVNRTPKKGTIVMVYFKNGDIYCPVYFGQSVESGQLIPSSAATSGTYPNESVLFSDQNDFTIKYNSSTKNYTISFLNGTTTISKSGVLSHTIPNGGVNGGTAYNVITEHSVDIFTAKPMSGRGTVFMQSSANSRNPMADDS